MSKLCIRCWWHSLFLDVQHHSATLSQQQCSQLPCVPAGMQTTFQLALQPEVTTGLDSSAWDLAEHKVDLSQKDLKQRRHTAPRSSASDGWQDKYCHERQLLQLSLKTHLGHLDKE